MKKMVDEKKVFLALLFVIGFVVLLSFSPGFTGYSVHEEVSAPEVSIADALPGSTVKYVLPLQIEGEDLVSGKILLTGNVVDWVSLVQEEYVFLPHLDTEIPLYVHIPEDAKPGEYTAKIALLIEQESQDSALGGQIISYVPITITVGSKKKEGFTVQEFHAYDSEHSGDVYFQTVVENLGNQPVSLPLSFAVYDTKGNLVFQQEIPQQFFAYEKKTVVSSFSDPLAVGEYYAKITAGSQSKVDRFEVVSDGELKQKGELLFLQLDTSDDALVKIRAYFKNTGEGVLSASMDGRVLHEEDTTQVFAVDPQIILPGEYAVFSYSYADALEGVYDLEMEILSGNAVLAEEEKKFYSSHAIGLETNVAVLFSLILLLLAVSHYMLSRRKK